MVAFYVFWTKTVYFYQVLEEVTISFIEELLERFLTAHQSEIKNILVNWVYKTINLSEQNSVLALSFKYYLKKSLSGINYNRCGKNSVSYSWPQAQ